MNNSEFAMLCSRAWSLPILGFLAGTAGARVSPTAHVLGAGRNVIGETYEHLLALGLIERTPGHGHPLRPEYRLRRRGTSMAAWAEGFGALLSEPERGVARRAWSLPVLRMLGVSRGFGELRTEMAPITDRALTLCLRRMVTVGWVERWVDAAAHPPRVNYAASVRGAELVRALQPTFEY